MALQNANQDAAADLAGNLVHPFYVLRVAGEPADLLDRLDSGETAAAWDEGQALRAEVERSGARLCAELEALVPRLDERAATRAALDIKRAIYKGKAFRGAQLALLAAWLAPAQHEALATLGAQLERLAGLGAAIAAAHERELAHGSARMAALAAAPNLRAALSYGNPDFLQLLQKQYAGARGADAKALRNLEDSLLQYYARCSTKTSPLSSFTVAHVGRWQAGEGAGAVFSPQLSRRVEIKAALLRHLLEPWLAAWGTASQVFPLVLNPSLRDAGARMKFTRVTSGQEFIARTWGTGVDIVQLERSPVLALIAHVFERRAGAPLMAAALCEEVARLAPKLPPMAVHGFVERLYGLGLLLADTGFHEQQDLLDWAERLCREHALPHADAVAAAIRATRAALAVMEGEDVEARTRAVQAVRGHMDALAQLTGADRTPQRFKAPFYENCYLGAATGGPGLGWLARHQEEFGLMQALSCVLDPNQEVHLRLCDHFIARFGEDGCCDDVVGFLEEADRIYTPGVLDGRIDEALRAPDSPRTAAWLRAKAALFECIEQHFRGGRDVALDPAELRGLLALVPPGMLSRSISYSYLVQSARIDGEERLVLNQIFGGRSSILSRFCEVLDGDEQAALRAYLDAGADAGRRAELGGVFGFNANRHPAMAAAEVVVPPFAPSFPDSTRLRLDRLRLRYAAQTHRLVFEDADGTPVDLFYHGLLNPVLLPQLQRVLALAFTEGPSLTISNSLSRLGRSVGDQVIHAPRLTLGKLVMSRRTWLVPYALCPDPDAAAADFWVAARTWQQRHGLPARMFVRAIPLQPVAAGEAPPSLRDALKNVNFKDMKPFYVDLRSPRFVRLLQNMMKRHRMTLCVTELLPDFGDHPSTVAQRTHVSELHFELTRPARPQAAVAGWHVIRVAYFDDRRALMTGPVQDVIDLARSRYGVERMFVLPHWKFGPHVDLVIHADPDCFHLALYPEAKAILEDWLRAHPSPTTIDPAAYEELSRRVAVFEIEPGPYLPLLKNNSVRTVPYAHARSLVLPVIGRSKEQVLSESLDLLTALYRHNAEDKDAVFLTLFAMLAATAHTPQGGMAAGYMSMRSHADYFFAIHDVSGALRQRFDAVEARRGGELEAIVRAVADKRLDQLPLAPALRAIVGDWMAIIHAAQERHQAIVAEHYEELASQTRHIDMARQMERDDPSDFRERIAGRKVSEIGDAFLNTEAGRARLRRPEFLTYRLTVNLYYALLPILEVTPVQKYLLCHLLANTVERVFGRSWRQAIERVRSEQT